MDLIVAALMPCRDLNAAHACVITVNNSARPVEADIRRKHTEALIAIIAMHLVGATAALH